MDNEHRRLVNEDQLREIIGTSMDGFLMVDLDGNILEANDAYCRMVGYSHDQILRMNITSIDALDREEKDVARRNQRILQTGSLRFETQHRHRDGGIVDIEVSVKHSSLESSYLFAFIRDISEQKRQTRALKELLDLYQDLVETSQDLIWQCDHLGKSLFLNQAWEDVLGYPVAEMLGRNFTDFQTLEQAERDMVEFRRILSGSALKGLESIYLAKSGKEVRLVFNAKPVVDEDGRIIGARGTAYDVTERRRAEEDLRQSQQRYKNIVESQTDFVDRFLPGGFLTYVNDALARFAGLEKKALLGKSFYPFIHEADREEMIRQIESISRENPKVVVESRVAQPDGRLHWNRWINVGIFNEQGALIEYQAVGQDVTERRAAEAALMESEFFLKESQRLASIGSYKTDLVTGRWKSSEALDAIFGIDGDYDHSIPGWLEIVHPDDREMMNRYLLVEVLSQRKPFAKEYRIVRKSDGAVRWVNGMGEVQVDSNGRVSSLIGTIQDITDKHLAEEALKESNRKLEALSITDSLTGIANRRRFDQVVFQEHARQARTGGQLSLIMLDIDYFKPFNDHYGHVAGDECLRRIARVLEESMVRPADLAARYGGEEFVCILPETDQAGALLIGERIRRGVTDLAIRHEWSDIANHITVSMGITTMDCNKENSATKMVMEADELLYQAKSLGRNRVVSNRVPLVPKQVHTELVKLIWQEDFCSGNPLIDAQHQALFHAANELLEAMLVVRPKEVTSTILTRILDEFKQHFRDEESLLESIHFPGSVRHAREHAKLYQKGLELVQQFMADKLVIGDIFQFLVYEVVLQHMAIADQEFFAFTNKTAAPSA